MLWITQSAKCINGNLPIEYRQNVHIGQPKPLLALILLLVFFIFSYHLKEANVISLLPGSGRDGGVQSGKALHALSMLG